MDELPTTDASFTNSSRASGSRSAFDAKERVRSAVAKGMSVAAGALEGVADELAATDFPALATKAIDGIGDTARAVVRSSRIQTRRVRAAATGPLRTGRTQSSRTRPARKSPTSRRTPVASRAKHSAITRRSRGMRPIRRRPLTVRASSPRLHNR